MLASHEGETMTLLLLHDLQLINDSTPTVKKKKKKKQNNNKIYISNILSIFKGYSVLCPNPECFFIISELAEPKYILYTLQSKVHTGPFRTPAPWHFNPSSIRRDLFSFMLSIALCLVGTHPLPGFLTPSFWVIEMRLLGQLNLLWSLGIFQMSSCEISSLF